MASLSASSTSSSSGLGNTTLRGFGGMASGIDRDALIEQLTTASQGKINKAKQETTRLEWKQEAIREITDRMIDLEDSYLSFTGSSSLRGVELFQENVLTPQGSDSATRFVKASGSSAMSNYLSIQSVSRLASSESVVSDTKGTVSGIRTGITADSLIDSSAVQSSRLSGTVLRFGNYDITGKFTEKASFTFPSSYKDESGTVRELDYTGDKAKLVEELNRAMELSGGVKLGDDNKLSFRYHQEAGGGDWISMESGSSEYVIETNSTALSALGYTKTETAGGEGSAAYGIRFSAFNASTEANKSFTASSVRERSMLEYLTDKKLSVSYAGSSAEVSLLTEAQKREIETAFGAAADAESRQKRLEATAAAMQKNLDDKFGSGKITLKTEGGALSFEAADGKTTLSISSEDAELRKNLGIEKGASNKLTLSGSLWSNLDRLGLSEYKDDKEGLNSALSALKINGETISGLTADSTVNDLLSAINSSAAKVKASYMEGSGRFVLIHEETGSGRSITLGDEADSNDLADKLFGATEAGGGAVKHGQDAELTYDYGNGIHETVTSSSNTFSIDGLKITVSGTFGVNTGEGGVRFSASANVDKATETVKKFFEAYNEIAEKVNKAVTTRPDRGYAPLTEKQKEEMSEKSIENWEKKAKEGILFSDSSVRGFSNSLQTVMSRLLENISKDGLSYRDLERIGITMSSDARDGGKINFDEAAFKKAMENEPGTVSKIFAGSRQNKGIGRIVDEVFTPYATRFASKNGGSYGELMKEAGSSKVSLSQTSSTIYSKLKENAEQIEKLKTMLKKEQTRYISQFSAMESAINKLNAQSSYLGSFMS